MGQSGRQHRYHRDTDHAQHELGDIVYVDLPKVGSNAEAGKTFGSVESVKAVSDIYSAVTGEIVEINETLASAPEKLNADPHGEAGSSRSG